MHAMGKICAFGRAHDTLFRLVANAGSPDELPQNDIVVGKSCTLSNDAEAMPLGPVRVQTNWGSRVWGLGRNVYKQWCSFHPFVEIESTTF